MRRSPNPLEVCVILFLPVAFRQCMREILFAKKYVYASGRWRCSSYAGLCMYLGVLYLVFMDRGEAKLSVLLLLSVEKKNDHNQRHLIHF